MEEKVTSQELLSRVTPDLDEERNILNSVSNGVSLQNIHTQQNATDDGLESLEEDTDDLDYTSSSDEYELEENDESLSTTIMHEIQEGTYTCLVCISEIDPFSKVWSCDNCYRVYDLECIKDWAIRGSSKDQSRKTWKCPSCNVETKKIPKKFSCWCGKTNNPEPNPLNPFSCGNPCNEPYVNCIHNCSSVCHPGKHPVCGAIGPVMKCKCGKFERQLPCLITPYEHSWRCDSPCDTVVCNLGHKCAIGECHLGFCGQCQEILKAKCYCGKEEMDIKCYNRAPMNCTTLSGDLKWIGESNCSNLTTVYYDCAIHFEEIECQPLPTTAKVCDFSPSNINTCYCGKTTVDSSRRTKCTDPVPECDSVCGKTLKCGCKCLLKCHSGECICYNIIEEKCSCENYSYLVPCQFIQQGHKPKCNHRCPVLLNCRKHVHKEVCCPYEQIALKRERVKKKAIRNRVRSSFNNDEELMTMEPIHICTRTCNRLKLCGEHYCEALCHSGSCGVCLESSNEDLVCHCGRTVIPAPVRCGTKINCHYQCVREKECGHRPEPHECHDDIIGCPKCTKLVSKECECAKKSDIPNILCSQKNVSCGTVCKVLKNCGHPCMRVCSSDCTKRNTHASSTLCQSACRKRRNTCPHYCHLKCHYNKTGKSSRCDATFCSDPVRISCACGRIVRSVPCGSSLDEGTKIGTILECDEECEKKKKDIELREALDLSDDELSLLSDVPYLEILMNVYERQTTWCSRIESTLRDFIVGYQNNKSEIEGALAFHKRLYQFPPMTTPQRAFIEDLASSYKLYTEQQDSGSNQSIFVVITESTELPELTISKAVLHKQEILLEASKADRLKQKDIDDALFNALIIQDVFFGIVKDELDKELNSAVDSFRIEDPTLQWMKESTYVFYSKSNFQTIDIKGENDLYLLMKSFRKVLREKSLAFDCKLCLLDDTANYILKIDEKNAHAPRVDDESIVSEISMNGQNNRFNLLGESEPEESKEA